MQSTRDGECYDCGAKWVKGELISANGHKTKAGKDYWCKNGTNCQGAMKMGNTEPTITVPIPREPTTAELWKTFNAFTDDEKKKPHYAIIESYILQCDACEKVGITNPITIGMIWNNYIRNSQ